MELIKFYGDACNSCERLAVILENEFPEANAKMKKINVTHATGDDMDLVLNHGVMTTPTLLLLDGKKEVKRVVGYDRSQVAEIINEFM